MRRDGQVSDPALPASRFMPAPQAFPVPQPMTSASGPGPWRPVSARSIVGSP